MRINVVQKQIQGDRDYQQDNLGQRDIGNSKLLILADGMGGYAGGEIASKIVVETFMTHPFLENQEKYLKEALSSANKKIRDYKNTHLEVSSMGTTLIVLLINEDSYRWISVGDSLLYLIQDNQIKRINENHSVAGMLNIQVERGEISKKEAKENKNRHMLTSAILGDDIAMINLSNEYPLRANDIFILASDGVETLLEDKILEIVLKNRDNQDLASQEILSKIESKNIKNQDNATLIIASQVDENEITDITISLVSIISVIFILIGSLLIWKEDIISALSNILVI